MPRELRLKCGGRVMTPLGVHEVWSYDIDGPGVSTEGPDGSRHEWDRSQLRAVVDIPRERVADLHAAAVKRLKQLDPYWDLERRARADELATFAEALRLLLEVDDDAA